MSTCVFVVIYVYILYIICYIMMLYQDTCSMVRSPDGNTEFFDIIAGVLQGDTFARIFSSFAWTTC